ncbi:pilus assembly protein CpaE [Selenomonas ruminantium]|uniref:Pilus assembly protein CpaE n=1 Tax=Selenomonas ruminantium TaxID=971 RepID=A0A1M6S4A3_SELRU|nr:pilus assembly protein CpaE [Selenomonas ruminantium]
MIYRVILVERNADLLSLMAGSLKADNSFDLASTYHDVEMAFGQSSVFRPTLFLLDVDDPRAVDLVPSFIQDYPKAQVIGLMENWKADVAELLLTAGACGCILKPFRTADILKALDIAKRRGQPLPTRTLAFFSPKGHAGQTTMAAVLAIELAKKSGESVALIDADLQFGDVAMFFDAVPQHNVVEATHDVKLLNPATLEPYFHPVGHGVWIMSGPLQPEHAELVEADRLIDVVRMAGSLFRYVLLDLPTGFNPISLALAECADTDILISMLNSGHEVRHMKRSLKMFHIWDTYGKHVYPVFSGVEPCTPAHQAKLEAELGRSITMLLPLERRITDVTGSGRIMKDLPEHTPFVQSLAGLAEDIVQGRR